MKLKQLLSIEELANSPDPTAQFKEIAEQLFNNYCIKKGDTIYQFLELEFYLYSEAHPDIITYPRNTELGDWFFHQSGVDICFKTTPNRGKQDLIPIQKGDAYGGILIRAVNKWENIDKGELKPIPIVGPRRSCYDIFDQFSAINKDGSQYPSLINKTELTAEELNLLTPNFTSKVESCPRLFNFDKNKKREPVLNDMYKKKGQKQRCKEQEGDKIYFDAPYRFYVPEIISAISRYENRPPIKK